MDIQLNFLQFQPQKNWFDYFVNRQEIFNLFNSCEDNQLLINLCDQFIEQALLADRDLAQFDQKHFDQEDLICLRHKSEDLWLFALCCFASTGWDLNALNKSSNIIRIQAFLNRLIRRAFEYENEQSLLDDPFEFICSFISTEKFTPSAIFFAWLYARWIFTVNLDAKFPIIPAKPTVSNPYQYLDTNLLQAEKLAQSTIEVQQKMPQAVKLMNQLAEYEGKLEMEGIEIPLKECFYPKLDIITKEHSILAILDFPKPNFENGKFHLERIVFKMITSFDLMVAHFCSQHFTQSRIHLEELRNYWTNVNKENLQNKNYLITINEEEIMGYSIALDLIQVNVGRDGDEPLIEFAKHRPKQRQIPTNLLIEMLKNGSFRIPTLFRERELRVDAMQRLLIQNFNAELNELRRTNQSNKFGILLGAIYFLCTHCHGFADTFTNMGLEMDGFRLRNFTNISTVEVPEVPSEERLQEFSNDRNALWNLLTTFDINILRNSFDRLDSQLKIIAKKMIFSPIIADPILNITGERFFNRFQIMLWKMEQLARLGNEEKWKKFVNKFSEECKAIGEHPYLILFDALRMQLANWNCNFYRPIDRNEFLKDTMELKKLIEPTIKTMKNKQSFQSLSKDLISYILNNREWKFVLENLRDHPQFDSPFTNFAVLFSTFFSKLQENKRNEAFKIAHEVMWRVISQPFLLDSSISQQKAVINKEQLLDVLNSIKDFDVISIFIGLTSFLYNFMLSTNQKPFNISLNITASESMMDTSIGGDDGASSSIHQQNYSIQLLRMVGRNIYEDSPEFWKPVKIDSSYEIDVPYIERVLDLLCRQAKLVAPIYLPWLRFRADYAFAREKYHKSAKLYLEILMAFERGLLGKPGIADEQDNELAKKQVERIQRDKNTIYGKLSLSLYFLQMPTLATIVGQMRTVDKEKDTDKKDREKENSHLNMVDLLLRKTPITVDSGPTYFPLISDIHLMERMAAIYEPLDFLLYRQSLLKSMPTRAINMNNSVETLNREYKRRKERFIEVLYKQFFIV